MGNLFRCGSASNNYKLHYIGVWGYNSQGINIRSVAEYPIFENKNIDVICNYNTDKLRFKTIVKLINKSHSVITSLEVKNVKTQKINVDLSKYSDARYFTLETGTYDHSGDNSGSVIVDIDVY